jgi:hypothetical protein
MVAARYCTQDPPCIEPFKPEADPFLALDCV